ncbi:transposase [Proteus cibi]|uniref:transposase n=1 Tax=Proteus cibi TaxID=2050966 RepID=UPI00389B156F
MDFLLTITEIQIINILNLVNLGMKVEDVCHQNGINNATYYDLQSNYIGIESHNIIATINVLSSTARFV